MIYDFTEHQAVTGRLLSTEESLKQFVYGFDRSTYLHTLYPSLSQLIGDLPEPLNGQHDHYLYYGVTFQLAYDDIGMKRLSLEGVTNQGFERYLMENSPDEVSREQLGLFAMMEAVHALVYKSFTKTYLPHSEHFLSQHDDQYSSKELDELKKVLPVHASLEHVDFMEEPENWPICRMKWVLAIETPSVFAFQHQNEDDFLAILEAMFEGHAEKTIHRLVDRTRSDEPQRLHILAPNGDVVGFNIVANYQDYV